MLGYGVQGRGQSLNMKDNGVNVIVGQREKAARPGTRPSQDGWVPGKTLFSHRRGRPAGAPSSSTCSPTPARRSTGRSSSRYLTAGKALYFSHGFSIVYSDQTGVVPPKDIDVILVAPKGSGTTVRRLFLRGQGHQRQLRHLPGRHRPGRRSRLALGIAIGSGYLFETTFQKEVFSDLTGERGVLMGAIYGLWLAQYEVLREHGHSPSEAFNETVEEATQSLYPLIAENGMDWMYANCSTTAQRGALDWFSKFRDAAKPVFEELYQKVAAGDETRRVLEANSRPRLSAATGEGTEGDRRQRNVAGRDRRPLPAPRTRGQIARIIGRARLRPSRPPGAMPRAIPSRPFGACPGGTLLCNIDGFGGRCLEPRRGAMG